ncbi:hypothetical protein ZPR_3969 [Zunongwangia profunda SM-A87]|uniref:Uncharacterized protein n=1 Tax=Zunongwangia profunda (strain DSM 18752 / CCTCC AB 206139 / SM-A87) TaxID=655815 RepID=D5B9G0_ZUNPS|nr:hypothetical protein ZPR_3969 [Zunongwangia profunda SM-A87]
MRRIQPKRIQRRNNGRSRHDGCATGKVENKGAIIHLFL